MALAFALAFVGYQYATDTLESRSMTGWLGSEENPAAAAPAASSDESADDAAEEASETSDEAAADAPADDASSDVADDEE